MAWRDRQSVCLVRHFWGGFFDLGFLSVAGADALGRTVIGVIAAILAFGLLLGRLFMGRYAGLAGLATGVPYQRALLADDAFLLGLSMWVVAFVTVLVSRSLVPDDTDFRVLMPLPVTRRLVFGSKLAALALFVGLFVVATHVALVPLFLLMSFSPWAAHALLPRAAAWAAVGLCASGFAVLAVTAVTGVVTTCTPRLRLAATSTLARSALMAGLVLALPPVVNLSAQAGALASRSWRLYAAPPVWFVGVERVLVGERDPYFVRLALLAAAALALVAVVTVRSYVVLYRRFDRVILRPPAPAPRSPGRGVRWRGRVARPGVRVAVRTFISATLWRSALHQGLLVGASACGVSLVATRTVASGPGVVAAAIWAPFALVFVVSLVVRATLALPMEERANWVFRITEDDRIRGDQLAAVVDTFRRLGVILPVVALAPVVWWGVGAQAWVVLAVASLAGLVLVEMLLVAWDRIPFTAAYIPGKRPVPRVLLVGWLAFTAFTTIGAGLARAGVGHPVRAAVVCGLLSGIVWALGRRRVRRWAVQPLAFDDPPPDELQRLRLAPD